MLPIVALKKLYAANNHSDFVSCNSIGQFDGFLLDLRLIHHIVAESTSVYVQIGLQVCLCMVSKSLAARRV